MIDSKNFASMLQLSTNERPIKIQLGVLGVLLLMLVALVIYRQVVEAPAHEGVVKKLKVVKSDYNSLVYLKSIQEEFDKYSSVVDAHTKKLDTKFKNSQILIAFESLFLASGVSVELENYSQPKRQGGFMQMRASYTLSGSYIQVRQVLEGLKGLDYLVDITRLNIAKQEPYRVVVNLDVVLHSRGGADDAVN